MKDETKFSSCSVIAAVLTNSIWLKNDISKLRKSVYTSYYLCKTCLHFSTLTNLKLNEANNFFLVWQ